MNSGQKLMVEGVAGKAWAEFYGDMQCQDAVLRRIEISGLGYHPK
jgi:hypothetical protein